MLDGLLQQSRQLVGAVGVRRPLGGAVREQQIEVLVEPPDRAIELIDGGARNQLAPQALERRREQ